MASDRAARARAHAQDERGLVIVMVAATMAALVVVVSLVINLGGARNARSNDQDAADAAALAAAANLSSSSGSNFAACTAAWESLVSNLGVSASAGPSCGGFSGTCDATVVRELATTTGPYTITLVNPVPDGYSLFTSQPAETADGNACDRIGIKISQVWNYLFTTGSTTVQVSAIGLRTHSPGDVIAPLVALDPHGCQTLSVTGSSHVTTTTASGAPGYVVIDSDGANCATGNKVIVDATGTAQITAGAIGMWALSTGNTSKAYDPSDVGPGKAFDPAPIALSAPVGRTAVDWRYNCTTATACRDPGPGNINTLVTADGSGTPAGYTLWSSFYSCNAPADLVVPSGNWYIDCPGGLSTQSTLTFRGGNIVSAGAITVSGSNALRINCDVATSTATCPAEPSAPSTLYFRSGGLIKSGSASVTMHETFVYLASGTMSLTGDGALDWTAPNDPTYPFDDLLLWNESSSDMTLTGSTNTTLEGIFFAPNATLALTGNTGGTGLGTQMFVKSASLTGSSSLTLAPRADRSMLLGGSSSVLIR